MAGTNLLHPDYYLPGEVVDNILVRLPIKEGVRTSILSSNWALKWHTMSKLMFNKSCLPASTGNEGGDSQLGKLVHIVDSVLSLHVGAIQRFELSAGLPSCPSVNRWIVILWRNHVKEIVLNFLGGEPYSLPTRLFRCAELTFLELAHCILKPSQSFSKLPNLENLKLKRIQDPSGRLGALISECPLLKYLSLVEIEGCNHLKFCAPHLQEFRIICCYFDLTIGDSPYVISAFFSLKNPCANQEVDHSSERLRIAKVINSFLNVKKLQLEAFSIQWLFSAGNILQRLPVTYDSLQRLHINIDFNAREELASALCLFRSFPNLEILELYVESKKMDAQATTLNSLQFEEIDLTFCRLKMVRIAKMIGLRQELLFIKCLLATAPLLRTITLSINHMEKVTEDSKIFVELMQYRRASTLAEIIYKDELLTGLL